MDKQIPNTKRSPANIVAEDLHTPKLTPSQFIYDVFMLLVISLDLSLILLDSILMSNFSTSMASWFGFSQQLATYQASYHPILKTLGGFFTIFLITEFGIRWFIAMIFKHYHRWFFFPFVNWYEALGCFPQLRALRLLRAGVIGYRLYQMGYKVLPQSWIDKGVFYYNLILEEISDRVIIVAIDNIKNELQRSDSHKPLIHQLIEDHRQDIETTLAHFLQKELAPRLQTHTQLTTQGVGQAVYKALADVPELKRYLRMIPIAGGFIEDQLQQIGQRIGENLTQELLKPFSSTQTSEQPNVNPNYQLISQEVANIKIDQPELEALIGSIVFASLDALKQQIAVQQWKNEID